MRVTAVGDSDVLLVEHDVHRDARGFFFEVFNERAFAPHLSAVRFVQDNGSAPRDVLRRLVT